MKYFDNIINDNILQNYIINGDMCVYQRKGSNGNTPIAVSSSAYTIDRFKVTNNSASVALTVSQVSVSDTERILVGAEKLYWLNIAGTSINTKTEQRVENLRQVCGKQMICSMWVIGTVGDTITPTITANFGTGGASQESVAVLDTNNTTIISTGIPQKIYFTFSVPAYTGYIFGTDNTSYLSIGLTHQSSGSSIRYTGWQANVGNSVVPFTLCSRNAFDERRLCERYYEKSYDDDVSLGTAYTHVGLILLIGMGGADALYNMLLRYRVKKRVAATPIVYSWGGAKDSVLAHDDHGYNSNCAVPTSYLTVDSAFYPAIRTVAGYVVTWYFHYVVDAEL